MHESRTINIRRTPRVLAVGARRVFFAGFVLGAAISEIAWSATATVNAGNASVTEGNNGTTTLNIPVTRSGDSTGNLVIEYQTEDETATAPTDYTAAPAGSLLRIPAGQSSANIGVTVKGDTTPETDQTLRVQLTRAAAFSPTVSFASAFNYSAGGGPFAVAIADLDGDGKPDLVSANNSGGNVTTRRNGSTPGSIGFAQAVNTGAGAGPISLAIGDVDGDDKPDLAVSNYNADTVSVLRNTSSPGTISFATVVSFSVGTDAGPYGIAIGDLDGDGKPDLVSTNYDADTVSVLRNTSNLGTISFAAFATFAAGNAPASVVIGDIDGDGKRDLAVANYASGDVSVLHGSSTSGKISFDGTTSFSTGTGPRALAAGDIDGDGQVDLAVANASAANVSVLRNTSSSGTVSFANAASYATGTDAYSVAIGDLDGNGKPDLAVANYTAGNVSVLLSASSSGNISFAAAVNVSAGTNPASAAIGDIDGDGKPDLAVANNGSANVSVLRNSPGFDTSITSNEAVGTIVNDDAGTPAAPTLTISVSPTSIVRGDSATLTWTSDDATTCTKSNAWTGAEAFSGSIEVTPSVAGSYTYTLTCTNSGGSVEKSATLTVTTPEPTLDISVEPSSIVKGQSATLTWSTTDATVCDASNAWSGLKSSSGSVTVTPATVGTHTYSLTCTGPGGSVEESATLTVTAPEPSLTISVSPESIVEGSSATLTWASNHVTTCTASDAWGGNKTVNGAIPLKPTAGTYTYTLTCVGEGDPMSESATLTVTPRPAPSRPSLKFTVTPGSIALGQSAVLAWTSAGTNSCTASNAWDGSRQTTGSLIVTPAVGTHTYTLTCVGPGGTKVVSVKLTVNDKPAKPTVNLTVSPTSIDVGGNSAALSWSSTNAASCTATGAWTGPQTPNVNGTQFVQPASPGTYTLSCTNSSGTTTKSVRLTVTRLAPSIGLSVLPTSVIIGRTFTLTWSALYANTCTASGTWAGPKVVGGTESRTAPTTPGTYTYTLSCTGAGGTRAKSVKLKVTPEPLPTVNLFVTPTSIKAGNSAELSWSSVNADSCTASDAWAGVRTTSGSEAVSPSPAGTYTYTLECEGPGGTATKSVRLIVTSPLPTVNFSVSPIKVGINNNATLTWSSTDATSCTASNAWTGTKAISGTQNVSRSAVGTYTDTLACKGPGGTTTKSTILTVNNFPYDGTWNLQVSIGNCYSVTHTVPITITDGAFSGHLFRYCTNPQNGATQVVGSSTSCGSQIRQDVSVDFTVTGNDIDGNLTWSGTACSGVNGLSGDFDSTTRGSASSFGGGLIFTR